MGVLLGSLLDRNIGKLSIIAQMILRRRERRRPGFLSRFPSRFVRFRRAEGRNHLSFFC
jgi:hypothetical protein